MEAGKPQKGLEFLTRAQPGERGERVADLQFNLGVARDVLGELGQATGHYLQAAQLYRSQGDGASEGDTCMKMARCHLLLQVCIHTFLQCVMGIALSLKIQLFGCAQSETLPCHLLNLSV